MTVLSHFPGDVKAGTGNRTLGPLGESGGFARFLEGSVWVGLGRSGKEGKEKKKKKEKGKEASCLVCR